MPSIVDFNPFTSARRDKFKCTLFCFRTYVEDASFAIAMLGIFFSIGGFLVTYKNGYGMDDRAIFKFFFYSAMTVLVHLGIIIALVTRMRGFCYPYIICQVIGILFNGSNLLSKIPIMLNTSAMRFSDPSNISKFSQFDRLEAVNTFVLLGLVLLVQIWLVSIVYRAACALCYEQIATKFVQDQREAGKKLAVISGEIKPSAPPSHSIA